jgi:Mce-associated membrane protein
VEDQQPAAGDLTDKTSVEEPEVDAAVDSEASQAGVTGAVAAEEAEATEATEAEQPDSAEPGEDDSDKPEADTEAEEGVDTAAAEGSDSSAPTRRRTGKALAVVAALVAALFVGSAAFAGATVQPYLNDRATVAIKLKVARTAANAITTLWTYTPENMDSLADRAGNYLSGDFGAQYRKFVDTIVAPNKQAKVSNSTEVTGVAVESLDGPNAVAIVYTNTTTTSPLTKNIPAMKYLSYRLIMKRDNARWLVTRMTTITSLDLTPHL